MVHHNSSDPDILDLGVVDFVTQTIVLVASCHRQQSHVNGSQNNGSHVNWIHFADSQRDRLLVTHLPAI